MDESTKSNKSASTDTPSTSEEAIASATKQKPRGKKRKREDSESSTDIEDVLPDNTLEVEKSLHASAIKNNLDDVSVKKILKKVVTNDHVLALVKLREEEEESADLEDTNLQPKLTRSKAKELMRVSPKSVPWNLELTPIKHIPVKTRPEVTALISNELHEDEDDDEYQPTQDEVASDDDQTLESCSDLESAPHTPATPRERAASPPPRADGPFKVPQGLHTPVRRKLIIEEEATIALRTRSKINLSQTPIEHIESSFVPPDEVPTPVVDEIWNQFLEECLNPGEAETSKNEEDDEADPEYNVAADPDAHEEDEDGLEVPILKISKKELNDLVTELLSVMPPDSDELAASLASNVLTDSSAAQIPWEGKQEPQSDEEAKQTSENQPESITDRDRMRHFSIGKSEPEDPGYKEVNVINVTNKENESTNVNIVTQAPTKEIAARSPIRSVEISVEEWSATVVPREGEGGDMPAPLRALRPQARAAHLELRIDRSLQVLPEQVLLIEQQLRQHIQLAASNFLQLFIHPIHWSLAPQYREYLEQFKSMVESNPKSIVNVCNLQPAIDLVYGWQDSVSQDTPENKELVEFIQKEINRSRRRYQQNSMYVGEFPPLLQQVVALSPVFLYPYLLPAMPYRGDANKKFGYRRQEDHLIALGLDQFWQYVEDNPDLYKKTKKKHSTNRWGLIHAINLVCKHMLPWMNPKHLLCHIGKARREKDNPIYKLFEDRTVTAVKHKLLPFNPSLTLYEQPEHEMPRIWARYLSKNSKRFRDHIYRHKGAGRPPDGVPLAVNVSQPHKNPLPLDFTRKYKANRVYYDPEDNIDDNEPEKHNSTIALPNLVPINIGAVGTVPGAQILPEVKIVSVNNNIVLSNTNETKVASIEAQATTNVTKSSPNKRPMITISEGVVTMNTNANKSTNVVPSLMGKLVHIGKFPPLGDGTVVTNVLPTGNIVTAGNEPTSENTQAAQDVLPSQNVLPANTTSPTQNVINSSNLYHVVSTNRGMYLIPIPRPQTTNTVNSINRPISTTIVNQNRPPTLTLLGEVMKKVEELKNHCQCCIMLRKLTKKQSKITDFFKSKEAKSSCECVGKKYPKISKRLKMLIHNYKSRFWLEKCRLGKIMRIEKMREVKENEDSFSLEDIEFVTSFQMKMTIRGMLIKNIYAKKRIYNLLYNFDLDRCDVIELTQRISRVCNVELVDVAKEFSGFLTAEQADMMNKFSDYFILNCLGDLRKKVDEDVKDSNKKLLILSVLDEIFADKISTSCEICAKILNHLSGYPKLAEHVFSLFPHRFDGNARVSCNTQPNMSSAPPHAPLSTKFMLRKLNEQSETRDRKVFVNDKTQTETAINNDETQSAELSENCNNADEKSTINDNKSGVISKCNEDHSTLVSIRNEDVLNNGSTSNDDQTNNDDGIVDDEDDLQDDECRMEIDESTVCDDAAVMDYEADHSSCGEDNEENNTGPDRRKSTSEDVKYKSTVTNLYETEITVSKTEVQEHSDSTNMSPLVMSEDEPVKSELPEWKREEDKMILEVLLQYLTPQERKEKTILEILDEKRVYEMLAESLPHKSVGEVKDRVMYLLEILVLSEY